MPDTPLPLFPDEKNVVILKDYINLQTQLNDVLLKQRMVSETIGHVNISLEHDVQMRLAEERKRLLDNRELLLEAAEIRWQTAGAEGVLATQAEVVIQAIHDEINQNNHVIEQLQMMNDLETKLAKKRFDEDTKWFRFITKTGKEVFGIKIEEYELTKSITQELGKYPYILESGAMVVGTIITLLKVSYELFKKFDKAAWDFRKAMGLTRTDSESIRKIAQRLAIDFGHIGVTADGAYEAVKALGQQMGGVNNVSVDLIKTVAVLKAQLGVSEETSAGFLRNMAGVSKSTMQSQQDMAYIAAKMSAAAGVPLDAIMKDIATKSNVTLMMMSRIPAVILRTAIEARRLNISINEMAASSRKILDFDESINAEMNAAVLLGRGINLQRARELAYRRDLEGSTKEILRITKQINFENLDVFQQEAFARATGKTVDELLRMVVAERQLDQARRDPKLAEKVAIYEKLRASNEAALKDAAKNYELSLLQVSNQERLTAITQKWNQLLAKAGEIFLPIIDKLLEGAIMLIGMGRSLSQMFYLFSRIWKVSVNILLEFKSLFTIFRSIGKFTGILNVLFAAWNIIKALWNGISSIVEGVKMMFSGNVWGGLLKVFHGLFQATIGAILGAIEGVFGFIIDIPILILKGLGSITGGVIKVFADWAEGAWKSFKDFLGFSPSKLGLSILEGIVSVGGMLFDALTSPFRRGLAWIVDKIPGMGKIAEKIRGDVGNVVGEPMEKRAAAAYIPAVTVAPDGTKLNIGENRTPAEQEKSKDTTTLADVVDSNNRLYEAIMGLRKDLNDGKIGINMDGQLLSATLARQTEFRGGYGVNKI